MPNLTPFASVLAVPHLANTSAYFRDVLGFTLAWPEGGGWQLAVRGDVRVMLGDCPDAIAPSALGDHGYFAYWHVDDAAALYDEFSAAGAIIIQPIADMPHGMREFTLATPDGHRMAIGQDLSVKR